MASKLSNSLTKFQILEYSNKKMTNDLNSLLKEIRACEHCKEHLPLGPRPVLRASSTAKLLIIGQAPGTKVHASGIPWDDASGNRLRDWLDMDKDTFYDESKVAIIPMGFCYPGKGKSGDLPPRKECAELWHEKLYNLIPEIQLTLLIGTYAQQYYLNKYAEVKPKATLSETVKAFEEYLPDFFPLVHPSPRNQIWLKKNPWFDEEVIPVLRERLKGMKN